jgi:hypothetical protein
MSSEMDVFWNDKAAERLVGRTIVLASYMTLDEAEEMGWASRPIVLQLDNGDLIFPQADDEGNEGGALSTNAGVLPVLPLYPRDLETLGDPEE